MLYINVLIDDVVNSIDILLKENNIVSYEQYKDALSILGMADGITGVAKGFNNNKMNEVKTHTTWAKKIVGLSHIYGVAAPLS